MGTRRYEFRVDGRLSEEARTAFVDMRITEAPPQTIIDGEVLDESHLHGIIVQLRRWAPRCVRASRSLKDRCRAQRALLLRRPCSWAASTASLRLLTPSLA